MSSAVNQVYIQDFETGVWRREGESSSFWYSDGSEEEAKLLELMKKSTDCSTGSKELQDAVDSWPMEYHLSPTRANLLRAIDLTNVKRVLEIGCGCGAITRYLGEQQLDVFALEGSSTRAAISATRCKDLPNVKVVSDSWEAFQTDADFDGSFDLVLLVGVLEYAGVHSPHEEPFKSCLETCRRFLSPAGTLLVAIENTLGTKYLAGHLEDHHGKPHYGTENLYRKGEARTFGKSELQSLLRVSGFPTQDFLYPYPDYKLPRAIISEQGMRREDFSISEMIQRISSRSYQGSPTIGFDEALVRETLENNRLLGEFANSFLVLATQEQSNVLAVSWLAKQFSPRGQSGRNTIVTFEAGESGIIVQKQLDQTSSVAVIREGTGSPLPFYQRTGTSPYEIGVLYDTELRKELARNGGLDEVSSWAALWVDYLRRHENKDHLEVRSAGYLPEHLVDCIPANLLIVQNGELRSIDQEWISRKPVPLSWVLIRGLAFSISSAPRKGQLLGLNYQRLIRTTAASLGIELTDVDFVEAMEWEESLQRFVFGTRAAEPVYTHLRDILFAFVVNEPQYFSVQLNHSRSEEAEARSRLEAAESEVLRLTQNQRQLRDREKRLRSVLKTALNKKRKVSFSSKALRYTLTGLDAENSRLDQKFRDSVISNERFRSLEEHQRQLLLQPCSGASATSGAQPLQLSHGGLVTGNGDLWSAEELEQVRDTLFNPTYYRSQLPSALAGRSGLFEHFLLEGWKQLLQPHPLFHTKHYLDQKSELLNADYNPLLHFLRYGHSESIDPHPLFDVSDYQERYVELLGAGENTLLHFLQNGLSLQLNPSPYFDVTFYLSQDGQILESGTNPLEHYVQKGWKEGLEPCPLFKGEYYLKESGQRVLPGETPMSLMLRSAAGNPRGVSNPHVLFHVDYYLTQVPPSEPMSGGPLFHFLKLDIDDVRSPCPLFDTNFYCTRYADVRDCMFHPFLHYVRYGGQELRSPHLLFDAVYYLEELAKIGKELPTNPLFHYFLTSPSKRISPHPLFDPEFYRSRYRKLLRSDEDPLLHFIHCGQGLGFSPNGSFDPDFYRTRYDDVRLSGLSPFLHYLQYGRDERRQTVR